MRWERLYEMDRDVRKIPVGARGLVVRYEYKEWENMGCFGNLIVVYGSVFCNILYYTVESLSLIRGRKHNWPNYVKISCNVWVIVLSLCSWTNIVDIKAFVGTTLSPLLTMQSFYQIMLHKKNDNEGNINKIMWLSPFIEI